MSSAEPTRRLFFALWPSDALQASLADATRGVVAAAGAVNTGAGAEGGAANTLRVATDADTRVSAPGAGGAARAGMRAVPARNYHVTLVFIGAVLESRLPELVEIAAAVACGFELPPVRITLDGIEYWKKPKIICATASESSVVASALAEILKARLTDGGFTPDLKPFRAHVTLARKVAHPIQPVDIQLAAWSFTDFALVDSRTESNGPVYTVMQTFVSGASNDSDS